MFIVADLGSLTSGLMYIPISNPAALEIPFISSAYGSGSIVSSTGYKRTNYMNLGKIK